MLNRVNVDSRIYIGYCTDEQVRYEASSGGLGVSIIKYLLDQRTFKSAISFEYCQNEHKYHPKLIHTSDDINNCGSIYQDIDIFRFLQNNIQNISDGIVLTCTPCQVNPIRKLLNLKSATIIQYTIKGRFMSR